jgi:hypothetical protein
MKSNSKQPEVIEKVEPQVTEGELLQIVLMWVKKLPYETAVQILEGAEKSRLELLESRKPKEGTDA